MVRILSTRTEHADHVDLASKNRARPRAVLRPKDRVDLKQAESLKNNLGHVVAVVVNWNINDF